MKADRTLYIGIPSLTDAAGLDTFGFNAIFKTCNKTLIYKVLCIYLESLHTAEMYEIRTRELKCLIYFTYSVIYITVTCSLNT